MPINKQRLSPTANYWAKKHDSIFAITAGQRLDQEFSGEQHASNHELLCKQQCLSIGHNSELYQLRLTHNGKLILTK
jgi:hemin uptake protein HemP